MIKTILVDDEARGLSSLKKLLELNCPELQVIAECRDAAHAVQAILLLRPQLVFLDISMPGKNGFDLLNELKDIHFEIIFVTAHNQYSLQAFRYSAVDYLLKPVDEVLLTYAVQRAAGRINTQNISGNIDTFLYNLQHKPSQMKLCVTSLKGFQVIVLSEIVYCEAESSYTIFHLTNGTNVVTSKSIIDYELLLEDNFFCRVHKSYLVNLAHIKEYIKGEGGSVILTNGREVEVSRRRKEAFLSKVKGFFKI
ncbi:LytR/AlgR family response regulator transcription factor [Puia sp. P3]|uniref:LytR/AlgR family response regulator transcription factor n=1 Tax=Puia sp. P3 TaxID=3423952 RepID=UPI003D6726DB